MIKQSLLYYDNHRITLLEVQYEIRRNDFIDGGHEINEATVEELEIRPYNIVQYVE